MTTYMTTEITAKGLPDVHSLFKADNSKLFFLYSSGQGLIEAYWKKYLIYKL